MSRAVAQQQQRRRCTRRPRRLTAPVRPSREHHSHASETGEWKYVPRRIKKKSGCSCLSWTSSRCFCPCPDDFPAIDTDSDVDDLEEPVEADSRQQISDCDSESCHQNPEPIQPASVSNVKTRSPSGHQAQNQAQNARAHVGCYAPLWTLDGATRPFFLKLRACVSSVCF